MAASQSSLAKLESTLEDYLVKKAPALPKGLTNFIVTVAPYLTLLGIILLLPVILAVFGLGAIALPFSYMAGAGAGISYTISLVSSGIVIVLEVLALPGLFRRQLSAWRLIFYASLINGVLSIFYGNLLGVILGTLISLYVLFQIKSYYK